MPIVIDTNCLANVFCQSSAKHNDFKPVLNWITKGKGIWVYGGSKYISELRKCPKYLAILRFLKESKKAYEGNASNIDKYEIANKEKIKDSDFDDPHIAAIVRETYCMIICSEDARSIKYIKNPVLYPRGFILPVYYTGAVNENLLSDRYVSEKLKPLCKMTKKGIEKMSKLVKVIS